MMSIMIFLIVLGCLGLYMSLAGLFCAIFERATHRELEDEPLYWVAWPLLLLWMLGGAVRNMTLRVMGGKR